MQNQAGLLGKLKQARFVGAWYRLSEEVSYTLQTDLDRGWD